MSNDLKELLNEVIRRLKRIEEQLDQKEVTVDTSSSKILERYPEEQRNEFWGHLRRNKKEGVDVGVICRVFNLRESQGYNLMKKIPLDYEEVGKVERKGNQASTLVKKNHYLFQLLREDYPDAIKAMEEETGEDALQKDWNYLLRMYAHNVKKSGVDEQEKKLEKVKEVCEVKELDLPDTSTDSDKDQKRQEAEEYLSKYF
jgi:hypothetical protein